MATGSNAGDAKQIIMPKRRSFKSLFVMLLLFLSLFYSTLMGSFKQAQACCGCTQVDCEMAKQFVNQAHDDLIERVETEFDDDLEAFENWLIEDLFEGEIVPATAAMIRQMSAVAMQYTEIIGAFIDAQTQMDTQRVLRELQYEAHRDYRPSDTFCYFGTNVRSLAGSESKGRYNALALSRMTLQRQLGTLRMAGDDGTTSDYKARWSQFVDTYCDPLDNNFKDVVGLDGESSTSTSPLDVSSEEGDDKRTGLMFACDHDGAGEDTEMGAEDANRFNRDINYTRLIEKPRTLDIDLINTTLNSKATSQYTGSIKQPGEEEDILAMAKNLYGHALPSRGLTKTTLAGSGGPRLFLFLRSVMAKRNVAQASFNAIVAMKSSGTSHEMTGETTDGAGDSINLDEKQSRRYMAAIIKQLLPADPEDGADNIFSLIGYSPSYFAQLEVLAKRIYQDPGFYVNLYETPANVKRKKVAMKAIELMVDRAIYESQIRREMSISVLLSSKLRAMHRDVNKNMP